MVDTQKINLKSEKSIIILIILKAHEKSLTVLIILIILTILRWCTLQLREQSDNVRINLLIVWSHIYTLAKEEESLIILIIFIIHIILMSTPHTCFYDKIKGKVQTMV